ncbi:MAG TPA: efflux RND transporter periplasmic adaptor subunit [Opitutaceae bacterium]|nr:efflux RND transporter periplasmic adaptor subunit [Lacunisphaera sp.]HWA09134.1 efflux RND transporter periplasmic adaptor subunit [Opitutaceae bacterium]
MKRFILLLGAFVLLAQPAANLFAHAGHDKAPGDDNNGPLTGPVKLTAEAAKNLGLKVETADLRTIEKTLSALGHVEIDPARVAALASRISGRVTRLAVKEGDKVSQGDFLFEIESRQIGDPPPHVEFKASISGTVLERHIFTGDNVEPDTQLLKIVDLSSLYVIARIYEGQIAQVEAGQKVRVRAEAYPEQLFEGTVEGHTAQLDPETRTLGVRVRMANPDLHLLPNMRAILNIVTAEADSVVAVPLSAVLGEAGNYFVFVQDDKDPLTFVRTPVVVGQRDDRYMEIVEGVLPGAGVVTLGNYQLQYVPPAAKAPAADAHDKADAAKPATAVTSH